MFAKKIHSPPSYVATQPSKRIYIHAIPTILKGRLLPISGYVLDNLDFNAIPNRASHIAKLKELWIIPFFFLITTGVSMIVAYVLGTAFGLKRSQRSFAMAAAMFMNSNSLPIALMQSLVITVPGLKWTAHDDKNSMIGRALTYLVLHSTLGMVVSSL
jgi:predicted permease